jgi:photosystem II stability/assembly factor-like uncharacterized protein
MKILRTSILIALAALFLTACSAAPQATTTAPTQSVNPQPQAGSFLRSPDGGKSWQVKNTIEAQAKAADFDVLTIAVNPLDENDILLGLKKGGILRSTNGGDLWRKTNFTSDKVYGLAFDPLNGNTIYASGIWNGHGKIWRSSDGGTKWDEIYSMATADPLVVSLTVDKINPKVIFVSTSDNQILKSQDGGDNWKNIFRADSPVIKMAIDSKNNQLVYSVNLNGEVWRSRNGGAEFENISKNINKAGSSAGMITVETSPVNGGEVFAGGNSGLFSSKDGGNQWQKIRTLADPKAAPVRTIAINPTNPREIIYGAMQALYLSSDHGESWKTFQLEGGQIANVLKYASVDSSTVYLGLTSGK